MFDLGMAADKMEAIFSDLLLENRIRSADRKKGRVWSVPSVLVVFLRLQRQLDQPTKTRRDL